MTADMRTTDLFRGGRPNYPAVLAALRAAEVKAAERMRERCAAALEDWGFGIEATAIRQLATTDTTQLVIDEVSAIEEPT